MNLKNIVEYLPLFAVLLIFIGFTDRYCYFLVFDIPIYHYLDSSEIILSFLPAIVKLQQWTTYFFVGLLVATFQRMYHSKTTTAAETYSLKTKPLGVLVLIGVTAVVVAVFLRKNIDYHDEYFQAMFLGFLAITLAALMFAEHFPDYKWTVILCYFMLSLSSYAAIRTDSAMALKQFGTFQNITFYQSGRSLSTSDSIVYIGETKSTLFLYDRKNKCSTPIDKHKIDSLSYSGM